MRSVGVHALCTQVNPPPSFPSLRRDGAQVVLDNTRDPDSHIPKPCVVSARHTFALAAMDTSSTCTRLCPAPLCTTAAVPTEFPSSLSPCHAQIPLHIDYNLGKNIT